MIDIRFISDTLHTNVELIRKYPKKHFFERIIASSLMCCMFLNTLFSVALAGPEGAQVVNGQFSFQQSGYNTTITASDKAIINYSTFDISRPEIVEFIQPNSNASVLNRILSENPTNINGTLLANGRVFFVNPAGVYIGAGARVNVNQLVASSLNITNSDFINGQYNFAGGDGSVINSGDISAEKVYLIGKQVANSGSIHCPAGYVLMAAGDRVFLSELDSEIMLEIDPQTLPEQTNLADSGPGVLNQGEVDADEGRIVLAAGDIHTQTISNVGSLAASVEIDGAGQVSNTGTIEARSDTATGGTVIAKAAEVTNSGKVDVTGSEGGKVAMEATGRLGQFGTIQANGTDSHGGSVELMAGDGVALSSESLTTANAGTNGDGGEVIVYSPDTALFHEGATIEAKGGSESGDGGFVEVSGKKHVEIFGQVDASSTDGAAGTFVIDPADITIAAAPAVEDIGDDSDGTFTSNADTNIILDTTIEGYLDAGTNVTLDTSDYDASGPYAGPGGGDIIVSADIDPSAGLDNGDVTFTLDAADNITVNAAIDGSGLGTNSKLNVELHANQVLANPTDEGNTSKGNVGIHDTITTNGGNFTSSGIDFDNTDGMISTGGSRVDIQNTGNVTIGAAINTGAGDVDIDGGSSVARNIISSGGIIISSGTINLEASGNIGVSGAAIDTASTGTINVSSTVAGDIYIDNTGAVTLGTVSTATSDIVINNSGDLSINSVTAGGDGDVYLGSTGDINTQTLSTTNGDIFVWSLADLILSGPVTSGGGIALRSTYGKIEAQRLEATSGNIYAKSQIDLILSGPVESGGWIALESFFKNIEAQELTATDNIFVKSTLGDLILNGPVTATGGGIELESTEGKIVFYDSGPGLTPIITDGGEVFLAAGEIYSQGNNENAPLGIQGATALTLFDTGPGSIELEEVGGSTIGSTSITVGDTGYGTIYITYDNARGRVDIDDNHVIKSVDQPFSFSYTAMNGDISIGSITTATGDIFVKSSSGDLMSNGPVTSGGGIELESTEGKIETQQLDATSGNISALSQADLILNGPVKSGGGTTLESRLGNIETQALKATGDISVWSNEGKIVFNDSGPGLTPIITDGGEVFLAAGEIYSQGNNENAPLGIQGATALTLFDTGPGSIELEEVGGSTIGSTSITVGDTGYGTIYITYDNARGRVDIDDNHVIKSVDQPFSFSYTAMNGDISIGSITTATGDIFVKSSSGDLMSNGPVTSGGGIELLSSFGNIEVKELTATSDISVRSRADLILSDTVSSDGGGVNLFARTGKIYTPTPGGADDTLNVAVTGYSDGTKGVDLPGGGTPDYPAKAAIIIESNDDLKLGPGAVLTADGISKTGVDDREGVYFGSSGEAIDVVIYLISRGGDVTVDSAVSIYRDGTMVIVALNKINDFGQNFRDSWTYNAHTNRLTLASRSTKTLDQAIKEKTLPHAEEAKEGRAPPWFRGSKYVLRAGEDYEVLCMVEPPVPLTTPQPPTPPPILPPPPGPSEMELMAWLTGEGIAPYLEGANPKTLNTDLRFYKAAKQLRDYAAILLPNGPNGTSEAQIKELTEMLDGIVQPGPIALPIAWFDRQLRDNRQHDEVLYAKTGGKWIDALIGFTKILKTQFGWPSNNYIDKVRRDYITRLKKEDHRYFIRRYLQSVLGDEDRPLFLASSKAVDRNKSAYVQSHNMAGLDVR